MATKPRASKRDTRQRGIDLALAQRLIDSGLTMTAVANVLGCSRPNISQRLTAARTRIAAAEQSGREHGGMATTSPARAIDGKDVDHERAS